MLPSHDGILASTSHVHTHVQHVCSMLLVVSLSLQPELYDGIIVKVSSTADSCGQLSHDASPSRPLHHTLSHPLPSCALCVLAPLNAGDFAQVMSVAHASTGSAPPRRAAMGDKVQPLRCRALTRLAGATSPDARALQVPFKGISFCFRVTTPIFEAKLSAGGACTSLGYFATDVQAACAYDDAVRSAGRRVVNFPRPGTDEVQAVRDETERATLKRLVAEKAGAEGGTTSRGISPLPKRHAVAAPPSEPPRKRAAARFEAQVKPELAAPVSPAPYMRRPPHCISPAAPVALDGASYEAAAAAPGVKAESPVACPSSPAVRGVEEAAPAPQRWRTMAMKPEDLKPSCT